MEIPSGLVPQVREGKVVLFLGAGASLKATNSQGQETPDGKALAELLANKFLGGSHKNSPLTQISEYAISEFDLITVQEYIREIFEDLQPTNAHKLMVQFVWRAIATTNFDRLIEKSYEQTSNAIQLPKPFIENGDRVDEKLRDLKSFQLLKLHGCITRTANSSCPLILSTDQYISYRSGRDRIFNRLYDLAFENTIVFIGYSLEDPDIRTILLELDKLGSSRPRYYFLSPSFDEIQRRHWDSRKITPIKGTFEEFLKTLNSTIAPTLRGLAVLKTPEKLPIIENFRSNQTLSSNAEQFLEIDVEYVRSVVSTETISPPQFYKGFNPGWSAIEQNLDVRRKLTDTIISDNILIQESDHRKDIELILIKAHAGAGKSVLLKRIAWDAAREYESICLYLKPQGSIVTAAIQEIINLCKKRIYLFIDDAADRAHELENLIRKIGPEGGQLTVVVAERINEWNISCLSLSPYVHNSYELEYLSKSEIEALLKLLETHRSLGTLEEIEIEKRREAFEERAGRQLLVALHEATLGRPFEEIIEDEYKNIVPLNAQLIYLTICTLNRLNVPVRAGIISRIHDIAFEDFQNRLFSPLEKIVYADYVHTIRDYCYRARHPHIAEIVFERILRDKEERFNTYLKCFEALNIDYQADRQAFKKMMKGRALIELFPSHEMANNIYQRAIKYIGEEPYLLHQMGIYEMNRDNGDLHVCQDYLIRAKKVSPTDQMQAIDHSIAELSLRLADSARTTLEREKFLAKACNIAKRLRRSNPSGGYSHHTLVKAGLKRLKALINDPSKEPAFEDIESIVKDIEGNLSEGLSKVSDPSHLLEAEAQLARLLQDSNRVLESLESAFKTNERNSNIGIRLARYYKHQDENEKAKNILERAINAKPNELRLNFEYSKLLIEMEERNKELLLHHLRKSFLEGDQNYKAQRLFGRQLFINGEFDESRQVFRNLKEARLPPELKDQIVLPLKETFSGEVIRLEFTYCFISRDGFNDWIYAHKVNIGNDKWKSFDIGLRVIFEIGFSMRGPSALNIRFENDPS
ncbi:P-loop NTPase [Candidatus Nitrospira salsa]